MAKTWKTGKRTTKKDSLKVWEKKISRKLDFLIVGIFFLIFAAAAVNEALEAKGMTFRSFLSEIKRKPGGNTVE